MKTLLDTPRLVAALILRDLTDPDQGPHAMQLVLDAITSALTAMWPCELRVHRACPIVTSRDNYDRLYYAPDGVARDARYTRWLGPGVLLRTQTSAMIPPLLHRLDAHDALLVCPGLVYRRDAIDRLHVGEPHQVDLWRVGPVCGLRDLHDMIAAVVGAALPGWTHRTTATSHPYTEDGVQIDVRAPDGEWIEIGECGLASPRVLADAHIDGGGLTMGLGLDRLVMLRKGLDDIRLLRSPDPRIASQMLDLAPYRPVSSMPPLTRDLSIAVDADDAAEDLGDRVRAALGPRADAVESVAILSSTSYDLLPPAARARLGIAPGQANLLVRVVLRDLGRTLTAEEGNQLRNAIYAALHRGSASQWAR
jgi:phenylalanyl-tRNA synthetase alpha chain